ncbi:MAG: PTS sugar transporter subunit IIA [Rhabdochlamydiaceae bacterium]|jgi:PTS system nitrogen regulatory IIA component
MKKGIQRAAVFFRNLKVFYKKEKPIKCSDYLDNRTITFLDVSTAKEAIEELVHVLDKASKFRDKEEFHRTILNRENILSTGIGLGIAVPHAKLASCKNFFIAIGIQKNKGIEWNSLDGLPVNLIFMIGCPLNRHVEYLNILARLTWTLKNPEKREAILKATTEDQVIDLFKNS